MIRIKNLDHVVLRSKDADRLVGFYCNVLGCTAERRSSPEFGIVQLRAGAALIDIVAVDRELGRMGGAAPGKDGRNMDHFWVRVDPFEEDVIREDLAQHGVVGSKLETRYGAEGNGPSIYIQDPDGNTVELKGPPNSKTI